MSIEEEKWTPFFSRHAGFHGNQENLFLAFFDYFFSELRLYRQPLSKIKVMFFFHKSISQVLSAANKKSSNRCSQATRDLDLYQVKQYLPIMKKSYMFNVIFLKNAGVEFFNFIYACSSILNHDISKNGRRYIFLIIL